MSGNSRSSTQLRFAFLLAFFFYLRSDFWLAAGTDVDALREFKSMVSDPSNSLVSWTNSSLGFCEWRGVSCGRHHPENVVALNLSSLNLAGKLAPALSNLTFLRVLDISNNTLTGPVLTELGGLHRLQQLNLSFNSFSGTIPPSMGNLSFLNVLDLSRNSLSGGFPSSFCNLSSLTTLKLKINQLSGELPSQFGGSFGSLSTLDLVSNQFEGPIPEELGRSSSLTFLALSNNSFSGSIPSSIANLSSLNYLLMSINNLQGELPPGVGNLKSLLALSLYNNNFTGEIPSSLGNISSLVQMDLSFNSLLGSIPSSIGRLSDISMLILGFNFLNGTIPTSLWNLSNLNDLELGTNMLSGELPPDMFLNLPNLQFIYLYNNSIGGNIPPSVANASALLDVELQYNFFTGKIPVAFGKLQGLMKLLLNRNQLEASIPEDWSFVEGLTNCTSLQYLMLEYNNLGGVLPTSIANLSTSMQVFTFKFNQIRGELPTGISTLVNLNRIAFGDNFLSGTIPSSIGMLQNLQIIGLENCSFTGELPLSIGNLTILSQLYLAGNLLNGSIPTSIGGCVSLEFADFGSNMLSGEIPKELFSITRLSRGLYLNQNSLSGILPQEIGSLINLNAFDASGNNLSGAIPESLGKCQALALLNMSENSFEGEIPSSLSLLGGISQLDLSKNNLSGAIPLFLQNLPNLKYLDLSFNSFDGEIPEKGVFANSSLFSIAGNKGLCGGIEQLDLPPCSPAEQPHHKKGPYIVIIVSISVLGAFLFVMLTGYFLYARRNRNRRTKIVETTLPDKPLIEEQLKLSYAELNKASDGFSLENLVGMGSFGSVYKAVLGIEHGRMFIAVKVFNLGQVGASKSFMAECEALRNVRHRNLLKILTSCSSVDFKGNEFKALVFEFMEKGSLEDWLHHATYDEDIGELSEWKNLNLKQRLDISVDIVNALDYLHNHGDAPIVHCDLKPSNILLDADMVAHVSDFGLARFIIETPEPPTSATIGLKGSIGYVAPEYGVANRVSTQGDVYSYGILLLEMFTGKRPTDEDFTDGWSLRLFVKEAVQDRAMEVVDPRLQLSEENEDEKDLMVSLFMVGLRCSEESPEKRMVIRDVVREMERISEDLGRLQDKILRHQECEEVVK